MNVAALFVKFDFVNRNGNKSGSRNEAVGKMEMGTKSDCGNGNRMAWE